MIYSSLFLKQAIIIECSKSMYYKEQLIALGTSTRKYYQTNLYDISEIPPFIIIMSALISI